MHHTPTPPTANLRASLLTRKEAAAYLGVKEQTLACWACAGRYQLPFVRIGRLVKYRLEDLNRFISENMTGGEGNHV